jgi:hypothetical protein
VSDLPPLSAVGAFSPDWVCTQPGEPGSSPACASCSAPCSAEPADVDPNEVAAFVDAVSEVQGLTDEGLVRWPPSPEEFAAALGDKPCPFHGPGCVADPREGQDFDWPRASSYPGDDAEALAAVEDFRPAAVVEHNRYSFVVIEEPESVKSLRRSLSPAQRDVVRRILATAEPVKVNPARALREDETEDAIRREVEACEAEERERLG